MVVGPLKRADEIGFQESFDLIIFLLVFRRELFIRDGLGSGFLILSSSHCCSGRCWREVSHGNAYMSRLRPKRGILPRRSPTPPGIGAGGLLLQSWVRLPR